PHPTGEPAMTATSPAVPSRPGPTGADPAGTEASSAGHRAGPELDVYGAGSASPTQARPAMVSRALRPPGQPKWARPALLVLVLFLVAGAYATVRAIETASTRWLAVVGVLVGLGFLTKMLQALLVVPAFALAYLVAAPAGILRRVRQLLLAEGAMIASAGWWV